MNASLRLSEKWFQRGLWLVALIFASFLIGLGNTIVRNLPQVEQAKTLEQFIVQPEGNQARKLLDFAQRAGVEAQQALEQAQQQFNVAAADSKTAADSLGVFLATRQVTGQADQNPEVLARRAAVEHAKKAEREALAVVQRQQQVALDARQDEARARARMRELEDGARDEYERAMRAQELRVFGYRLLLTLPLLVVAGWLFAKKRRSTYWPFVWGFILFALFAFFVELVPYLPSYGGYVRYIVGIIITVLVGRYAIRSLNRYLAQQRAVEQLPDAQRRDELSYDVALARLAKKVCPGCERPVDIQDPKNDYCPHCGICLHNCCECGARKSAFARFCHACGRVAVNAAGSRLEPN
jgi:hypothetical protein